MYRTYFSSTFLFIFISVYKNSWCPIFVSIIIHYHHLLIMIIFFFHCYLLPGRLCASFHWFSGHLSHGQTLVWQFICLDWLDSDTWHSFPSLLTFCSVSQKLSPSPRISTLFELTSHTWLICPQGPCFPDVWAQIPHDAMPTVALSLTLHQPCRHVDNLTNPLLPSLLRLWLALRTTAASPLSCWGGDCLALLCFHSFRRNCSGIEKNEKEDDKEVY